MQGPDVLRQSRPAIEPTMGPLPLRSDLQTLAGQEMETLETKPVVSVTVRRDRERESYFVLNNTKNILSKTLYHTDICECTCWAFLCTLYIVTYIVTTLGCKKRNVNKIEFN